MCAESLNNVFFPLTFLGGFIFTVLRQQFMITVVIEMR